MDGRWPKANELRLFVSHLGAWLGRLTLGEGCDGGPADLFGRAVGCDWQEQRVLFVIVNERGGALFIGFETHLNGSRSVVFALEKSAAAFIADTCGLRWPFRKMKDSFALFASTAAAETRHDFVERQFVIDDSGERKRFILHQSHQGFGLVQCAREAIQDKAASATQAAAALQYHFQNNLVGYQITPAHIFKRSPHGGADATFAFPCGGTKDVSSGEMAGAKAMVQQFRLGPLSDAGSAEQNQPPWLTLELGVDIAFRCRPLKP